MYNMQLWETSGHAANYKENMFVFEVRFILLCEIMAMTSGESFQGICITTRGVEWQVVFDKL